ncbi:hypothetical protein SADUNF_Sadunf08G0099300 [Salix dunnii]|uniref:UspA domain-containing protein n=1 Tax=Salix dunnii TaxID=1413687 RepID=A0A835JTW5_9ROSI|nr:hypothetical protein SADUNF_Sadunf08G0099300 [Salix dunnii]
MEKENGRANMKVMVVIDERECTMDLFNSVQQQNKKVALGLLEKAERICASKGVIVEAITEAGYPKEVICDAVQKCGVNLLVIGDKENGNIKRALQGSVSSYRVENAKCQNKRLVSGGDCIQWDQKSTEIAIKSRQSLESEA